jgi:hypothetical protein
MNDFTCERCHGTFGRKRTEEEARKEFQGSPWYIPGDESGVLCEDCFQVFRIWFDGLTEADHKRIRSTVRT